jgi:ketosteroid isomerase-like protein
MPEDNLAIIEAVIAASQRGDWETALAAYDADAELDQSRMPDGGIYRGPHGVRDFYTNWFAAWEDLEIEFEGARALPDGRVISLIRLSGRGRASGVPVSLAAADVFTLRDGKIVHMDAYPERDEALKAVGLSD